MAHEHKPIILIIDDEQAILSSMANILQDADYQTEVTTQPNGALDLIGKLIPDLVFLDIFMPNTNGLDLLAAIKKEFPAQMVVIISGYGNISLTVDALKKGAIDFLEKPFSAEDLLNKAAVYCSVEDDIQTNEPTKTNTCLVGESYLFKELMHYVDRIVPLDNHVLIYGPRGIGKTQLAQYMHDKKNNSTTITIINGIQNPALTIDEKTLRTEGTVIIRYVDALTSEAQTKLLTILESPNTKARMLCLTHKNLFTLSTQGTFNEDLFYMLSSTPIEIPSLNKRRFDIPLLVNHFLTEINHVLCSSLSLSATAIRLLRNHTWQEHCRELKQLLMQAAINQPPNSSIIMLEQISLFLPEIDRPFIEEQRFQGFATLDEATSAFQKKYLLYQLKKNRYDLNQVSNALSMKISDLHNEIARLNIPLST